MYFKNQNDPRNYFPNSFHGASTSCRLKERMCSIDGPIACHDTTDDLDYFSQPRIFYRQILTADERTQSARNLARSLSLTQQFISK